MGSNQETTLKKLLQRYSFEDIVKSFFVLNLWLPNVSSHTKSQYIYAVLESVIDKLQSDNKIHTYQDFKSFIEKLLPLINDLIKKIEEDGSMNYPKMTKGLIAKLIKGVKESPRITEDIKKLL